MNREPIIINDDDDIQIIEAPKRIPTENASSQPSSHTSAKVTSFKPKERTVQIIDDPIDYLIPSTSRAPSSEQHLSSNTRSLTSGYAKLSVAEGPQRSQGDESDDTLEYTDTPKPSPEPQNQRAASLSNPYTGTGACLSFPASASTPASVTLTSASSSGPDVHQELRERRSTPTPTSTPLQLPSINPISNEPHTQTQHKPERPPIFHPSLLPHYINARYRSFESNTENDPTKISDIWYLSAVQRSKLGTRVSNSTSSGPALRNPRKKKIKAVRNHAEVRSDNPNSEALASKDPFFFFAGTWMKEKENSLATFLETS